MTKKTPPPFEPDLTAERPTGRRTGTWSETVRVPAGTSPAAPPGTTIAQAMSAIWDQKSEPGERRQKPVWGRIANVKSLGWAIYAIGFALWVFGYLSPGHAPLFDWKAITPWWISSFVPNLEAELGMVLMFASMIPIYGGAVRKRAFAYTALLVFVAVTLAWWWLLAWLFWNAI